jgi:hypothetical protein
LYKQVSIDSNVYTFVGDICVDGQKPIIPVFTEEEQ